MYPKFSLVVTNDEGHQRVLSVTPVNDQKVIPRPFGEAVHGRDRNEVLHFDFISMHQLTPKSKHLYNYVLILKEDFSGFEELIPTTSSDHFTVADSRAPQTHVSDQGSHSVDKTLKEFNRILQAQHHFVTAYIPWANGTVEIVYRQLQSAMTSLLCDFRMQAKDWSSLFPWFRVF